MKTVVIAYVPVLHDGYRKFFEKHRDADALYIFGPEIIARFDYLAKEIRALDPALMKRAIESLSIYREVEVLDNEALQALKQEQIKFIAPDEDVTRQLIETEFSGAQVTYDTIFLRWDKHKTMDGQPVDADQTISTAEFDKKLIELLGKEAEKSSDFWRRLGSAIVKDGKIILVSHNRPVPSDQMTYAHGDPRNTLHKGVGIEYSLILHAEAALIAEAAKKGISVDGASCYVTVFPCPPCAKLIAYSGIKKLYYTTGYALLDQDKVLKSQGVELIHVDMK